MSYLAAVVNITNVGDAIMLPQGSVHYVANTGCYPGIFVNGFKSVPLFCSLISSSVDTFSETLIFTNSAESPGVLFISQAIAAFDEETYSAAFGGIGVNMVDSTSEFSLFLNAALNTRLTGCRYIRLSNPQCCCHWSSRLPEKVRYR